MDKEILQNLQKELAYIKARNKKVEIEKAWETSFTRMISITLITYIIAAGVMYIIGVENIFTNALIPTIGYILSTQSLPIIRKLWVKNFIKN